MEQQPPEQAAPEPLDCGEEGEQGGPPLDAGASAAPRDDDLSLLLRLRAQTKQQLLEYKSMADASEEKNLEQITQEKQIEAKIEHLENELEEAKVAFEVKKLALDRMQLSAVVKRNLEKCDTHTSALLDSMKHIFKLSNSIIKLKQESQDLEAKLLDVRKKRLQLKQASESKFIDIKTEKDKQKQDLDRMEKSEKIKAIQERLQVEVHLTTVIQNVFQSLILGSKINWAEDPALKEIVLQLERNFTTV